MDREKRSSKLPVDEPKSAGRRCYNSIRSNSPAVPVNDEEDVIVYDGTPVPKSGNPRPRPNSTPSTSVWGVVSQSKSDNSKFKSEVYRLWESYRTFHDKNTLILDEDYYKLRGPSLSQYGPMKLSKEKYGPMKLGSISQFKAESPLLLFSPSIPTRMGFPIPIKPISTALSKSDWSPEEDGIQVILPSDVSTEKKISSKEDVDAYINKVLYGNNNPNPRKKRLPVFEEICPDK